jgi:site-specific DNA recombinase
MKTAKRKATTGETKRCAIYTRKSTEEGLEQEFNSLDAQRESGEAYVKSQQHEGWECLPELYDDGGFTGGNMERPALRRLMADIEAGHVDCVVVYKVDRLSRSLLDFARMMETFDKHRVAFVSVTQQFNTSTSMGRLVLNVLLSFAQFEREIISERTRDKIAAARRKGKWTGGMPLLGYDVDPRGSKLIVHEEEATQVQAIFELYLEHQSLITTVRELDGRGWTNKRWTTRKGNQRGGKPFSKTSLYKLLTNVTYVGKLKYKAEVHAGEHAAILDDDVWQQTQLLLRHNGCTGGSAVRNKFGALLKGVLHCAACNCAMSPTHSTKNGNRRYRYYLCTAAQKRGWDTCPSKSIPAGQIERLIVDQIKSICRDPTMLDEQISQVRKERQSQVAALESRRRGLEGDLAHWNREIRSLLEQLHGERNGMTAARLTDVRGKIDEIQKHAAEVREEIKTLGCTIVDERAVTRSLATFEPVWDCLTPPEQVRIVQLLIERVDFDGATSKITIKIHPHGIKKLADKLAAHDLEPVA